LKLKYIKIVSTSKKTHRSFIIKEPVNTFKEATAVYSDNVMKSRNILCEQNTVMFGVTAGDSYIQSGAKAT